MKVQNVTIFLTILSLSLIVADVEAGWKFWKKKDKDSTTTVAPDAVTPEPAKVAPDATTAKSSGSPGNVGSAVIGASDPGLAIGVSSTGGKIKEKCTTEQTESGNGSGP